MGLFQLKRTFTFLAMSLLFLSAGQAEELDWTEQPSYVENFLKRLPAEPKPSGCFLSGGDECLITISERFYESVLETYAWRRGLFVADKSGFTVVTVVENGAQHSLLALWRFDSQGEFVTTQSHELGGIDEFEIDRTKRQLRINYPLAEQSYVLIDLLSLEAIR